MTETEARHIARQYVAEMGEVFPGFRFGIGNTVEFTGCYCVDFIWLTMKGEIPKEAPLAGGVRGLKVDKTHSQVSVLSHGEYASLMSEETELTHTYQLLSDFKNEKKHLPEIKAKYNLTSIQLLKLSKIIRDTELNRATIFQLIQEILPK